MQNTSVAIVGIASAGKSSLLYALHLLGTRGVGRWLLRPNSRATEDWIKRVEKELSEGKAPPRSADLEDLRFRVEPRDRPDTPSFQTRILDVAGEVVEAFEEDTPDAATARRLVELEAFVAEAAAVIVVVDPERLASSPETLEARLCDHLALTLHENETTSGRSRSPLALLFTKADLFRKPSLLDGSRQPAGEAWLDPVGFAKEHGLGGLFPSFERHLQSYRLFAVSAFGRAHQGAQEEGWAPAERRMEPRGVAEAFDWIMDEVEAVRLDTQRRQRQRKVLRAGLSSLLIGAGGLFGFESLAYGSTLWTADEDSGLEAILASARYLEDAPLGLYEGWAHQRLRGTEPGALEQLRSELPQIGAAAGGAAIWSKRDALAAKLEALEAIGRHTTPNFQQAVAGLSSAADLAAVEAYVADLRQRWAPVRERPERWVEWVGLWSEAVGFLEGRAAPVRSFVFGALLELRSACRAADRERLEGLAPLSLVEAFSCDPPSLAGLQQALLEDMAEALHRAWDLLPTDEPPLERWARVRALRPALRSTLERWRAAPADDRDRLWKWITGQEESCRALVCAEIDSISDPVPRAALVRRAREVGGPSGFETRWRRARADLAADEAARWAAIELAERSACGPADRDDLLSQLDAFLGRFPRSRRAARARLLLADYRALLLNGPLLTRICLPNRAWQAAPLRAGEGRVATLRRSSKDAELSLYLMDGAEDVEALFSRLGGVTRATAPASAGRWRLSLQAAPGELARGLLLERAGRFLILLARHRGTERAREVEALMSSVQAEPTLSLRIGAASLSESAKLADYYLELQAGDSLAASPWATTRGRSLEWSEAELKVSLLGSATPVLRLLRHQATQEDEVVAVWRVSDLKNLVRARLTLTSPRVTSLQVEIK